MASGQPRGTIDCGQEPLNALAFTRGGEALAVAGEAGTVRLWDIATGLELLTLQVQGAQVNGLAFSPDGQALASCGHDGSVRLWSGR